MNLTEPAQRLLRFLLSSTQYAETPHDELFNIPVEDSPEALAAVRELAGAQVDINVRPATAEDLRGLPITKAGNPVIVTSSPVLLIESELARSDTREIVSVAVKLGGVPRDKLQALAWWSL